MIILSPSVLSADFANMERDVNEIKKGGAKYVHLDVMDGHFVPNLTFGPDMVKAIRKTTDLVLDVHLMVEYPEKFVDAFLDAGADIINVHYESKMDFQNIYETVKSRGKKIAMTINPDTPAELLIPYLPHLDMVLIMSVHPGYGGQKFIESSIDKIKFIRKNAPNLDIEIDGGVKIDNVDKVISAGANVIVAGSAIFNSENIAVECEKFIKRGESL